jgi:lipopolysaccharide transport system permease protein
MTNATLIIEPDRSGAHYWRELWSHRELFWILAWRDVSVRYKQTSIGIAWAILRPLLTVLVFTVIFGKLAKLPSDGRVPYALMVAAGMLPWYLFATSLAETAESLVSNAALIGKVYFPRMIIPAATILAALVDFACSFVILLGVMVWYRFAPGWQILMLPLFVVLAILTALGPGLWMSALNVKYRDFRYIIPFVLQFGIYVSPVAFSSTLVPHRWRVFYNLNPMVGVIDGFRWCILGGRSPAFGAGFAVSIVVAVTLLYLGVVRFRKIERAFADLI